MLIKPIRTLIPDKDEWIIVPDGFLYFLPFESLPFGAGGQTGEGMSGTLLETTTISYQFASRLILTGRTQQNQARGIGSPGVLAFAPFTGRPLHDGTGSLPIPSFTRFAEEIAGLPGIQYLGSQATKSLPQSAEPISHRAPGDACRIFRR
jgi:hypothetical protein